MAKKKSKLASALSSLESRVSPIVEVKFKDPLFSLAAHPTRPILATGLATGHLFCVQYDAEKLEEKCRERREKISLMEKEAFKSGKLSTITKSVSQLKSKWWTIVEDNTDIPSDYDIVTNWKTKRHKGSCRSVIFDPLENSVGENLYSVGTDHIIKKANTETGKVVSKITTSDHYNSKDAITKLSHSTSHPFLLAGTENGHVLVYDSSNLGSSQLKFKVTEAHEDSINDILPMPTVSAYHYLTLGSTTLSHIDIRKGIITQSDDQADELLSMCYASDNVTDNNNDTVLIGHGEGIVTIWKNSKNKFMDQLSRIKVNKNASIDAIISTMNCDNDDMANSVWCGDSDGLLHRINYKKGKVMETRVHSSSSGKYGAIDEIGILDIDYDYRLISAGMESLKIWSNTTEEEAEIDSDSDDSDSDSDSSDDSDDSGSDSFSDSDDEEQKSDKSGDESSQWEDVNSDESADASEEEKEDANSDKSDGASSEEEEEEEKPSIVRKKRFMPTIKPKKRIIDLNKLTKAESEDPEPEPELQEPTKKKPKVKKLTAKQLKNAQAHEHGIRKFDGL